MRLCVHHFATGCFGPQPYFYVLRFAAEDATAAAALLAAKPAAVLSEVEVKAGAAGTPGTGSASGPHEARFKATCKCGAHFAATTVQAAPAATFVLTYQHSRGDRASVTE